MFDTQINNNKSVVTFIEFNIILNKETKNNKQFNKYVKIYM